MHESNSSKIKWLLAITAALFIASCRFPYDPKPFTLPEPPYKFPGKAEIQSFFDTTNVKIVYTLQNNGRRVVFFVDFNDSAPSPKRLKQPAGGTSLNADSPLLSPDGSFVAFYLTDNANANGAYIQRLDTVSPPVLIAAKGTEPHWWADPANGRLYIIYSDKINVSNLDTKTLGSTFRQEVSLAGNGSLVGTPSTIAPYPMNGGLSNDGSYICTGYDVAAFYNLPTQQLTVINSSQQVCNPSIDPDPVHPDRMMFLNIGGKENLRNLAAFPDYPADASGNVDRHVIIFIVDVSNSVQDFVPLSFMGNGYQEWQDPEWSNRPNFSAALACIDDANADGVILKNIGNHAAHDKLLFTRGTGKLNVTSTPCVWIGK